MSDNKAAREGDDIIHSSIFADISKNAERIMKYTLQEGSFSLFPAAWQDTSMNILRDDHSGLSVVVSRGTIPEGSDLTTEFNRQ